MYFSAAPAWHKLWIHCVAVCLRNKQKGGVWLFIHVLPLLNLDYVKLLLNQGRLRQGLWKVTELKDQCTKCSVCVCACVYPLYCTCGCVCWVRLHSGGSGIQESVCLSEWCLLLNCAVVLHFGSALSALLSVPPAWCSEVWALCLLFQSFISAQLQRSKADEPCLWLIVVAIDLILKPLNFSSLSLLFCKELNEPNFPVPHVGPGARRRRKHTR